MCLIPVSLLVVLSVAQCSWRAAIVAVVEALVPLSLSLPGHSLSDTGEHRRGIPSDPRATSRFAEYDPDFPNDIEVRIQSCFLHEI